MKSLEEEAAKATSEARDSKEGFFSEHRGSLDRTLEAAGPTHANTRVWCGLV